MRILFITSFYSALRDSILNNNWQPKGMPAYYKLLEYIDQDRNMSFNSILIHNSSKEINSVAYDCYLNRKFIIVFNEKRKTKVRLTEDLLYFFNLFKKIKERVDLNDYDLVYIDRANIGLLPLLKWGFKGKIVIRLHGVATLFQDYKPLKSRVLNWYKLISMRLKVDAVIATLDGTPVSAFMDQYMCRGGGKYILVNGVEKTQTIVNSKRNKLTFLFLGRLEKDKGILEILEAFMMIPETVKKSIELIVVGEGSLKEKIERMASNINCISIIGGMSHTSIAILHKTVDITLSINYLGNISNVVLEAIENETAIITLKKDTNLFFDIDSNKYLGENVMYVNRNNVTEDLKELIVELSLDPRKVDKYINLVISNLKCNLVTWERRINEEVSILKAL